MAEQKDINCFKDLTIDGQLYEILSQINGIQNASSEEDQIESECFKDLTIDGQLYEISKAIAGINQIEPIPHAPTHFTDGTDPIAPENIGAVPETRTIVAGTGLTGGGDLSANRAFNVLFGTASGTVCEGNDPRLAGLSVDGTIEASQITDFTSSVEQIISQLDAGGY